MQRLVFGLFLGALFVALGIMMAGNWAGILDGRMSAQSTPAGWVFIGIGATLVADTVWHFVARR